MLALKRDVRLVGLSTQILLAVIVADRVYSELGYETVITSLNDGEHKKGSLHYKGNAVDIRTKHLPDAHTKFNMASRISNALGPQYDVILEHLDHENEHLHIEYDPKG